MTKKPSRLAALVIAGTVTASAATWQKLENLPVPNGGLVCGEAGGKLILIGGTNWETGAKKNWLNEVHEFDPATGHWRRLGALPQPFAYGVGGTVGDAFIMIGGTTGAAPFTGVIQVANGKVSERPTGGVTVPAVLSAGGIIGNEVVFVGGTDDPANLKGFTQRAYAWEVSAGTIRTLPPSPGGAFGTAASVVVDGDLYAFGGAAWDAQPPGVANLAQAMVYLPRQQKWKELKPMPLALRGTAAVALDDRHIYLGGGHGAEEFVDQGLVYDIVADTYRPAPPLPYKSGTHLARIGEWVYCLGGEDGFKHRSSATYRIRAADLLAAR